MKDFAYIMTALGLLLGGCGTAERKPEGPDPVKATSRPVKETLSTGKLLGKGINPPPAGAAPGKPGPGSALPAAAIEGYTTQQRFSMADRGDGLGRKRTMVTDSATS